MVKKSNILGLKVKMTKQKVKIWDECVNIKDSQNVWMKVQSFFFTQGKAFFFKPGRKYIYYCFFYLTFLALFVSGFCFFCYRTQA